MINAQSRKSNNCWLLITSRSTPKYDEHTHKCTHTLKRGRRMRNKRGNALKPLKTHIQPSRGRKECSDAFRDDLRVPMYRLTRKKKKSKNVSQIFMRHRPTECMPRCACCTHLNKCYNYRREMHACARGVLTKNAPYAPRVWDYPSSFYSTCRATVPTELRATSGHWHSSLCDTECY